MGHGRAGAMGCTVEGTGRTHNLPMAGIYQLLQSCCLSSSAAAEGLQADWIYDKGALRAARPSDEPALSAAEPGPANVPGPFRRLNGVFPILGAYEAQVNLKTIFFNGCNTVEAISQHKAGAAHLLAAQHHDFLILGGVVEVDWANGMPATSWLISTLLLQNQKPQDARFRQLTAMLRGIGQVYHAEHGDHVLGGILPPVYAVFLPGAAAGSLQYHCGHAMQDAEAGPAGLQNTCAACSGPKKRKR